MPYLTQTDIETSIPAPHLVDALDDDRDGSADANLLDEIIGVASNAVDSYLASLYSVPFADPAPAAVKEAAFVFTCELIYQRRRAEPNPWKDRANFWRTRLEKIGDGKLPLDAGQAKEFEPGKVVAETMATTGTMR